MKLRQTRLTVFFSTFVTVTALIAALVPNIAFAYKCTGVNSTGVPDYYKNGVCYQAVGTTCLDNPPSGNGTCQNRDQSQDTVQLADVPVHNDGTPVTSWTCSKGTYNSSKHDCEVCTGFGNCQAAGVNPTPSGADTTTDPNSPSSSNSTTSQTKGAGGGGSGTCAGVKTDYFACNGNGSQAVGNLLTQIILIVSVGVGIIAVGGVVWAAILYASAQDNQDQIRKSVFILRSVGIGIILYVLMVAIVNFLIPGGVFTTTNNNCSSTTSTTTSGATGSSACSSTNTTTGNASTSSSTSTNTQAQSSGTNSFGQQI